jgi:translation initiation factor IF-2
VSVEISAKHGTNVDKLLEMILLVAEMLDLTAQPARRARGVVIEARREAGRGIAATVLIQNGTLNVGQPFVCGNQYGKVRAMSDERGGRLKSAGPSTPVEVIGWSGVPQAGDVFNVVKNETEARQIAGQRAQVAREHEYRLSRQATSLMSIQDRIKRGELHDLNLVIKADVGGSLEVLRDTLQKLSTDEVKVRIIHTGVGLINESDVLLAVASGAIIIGFHTRPDAKAHQAILSEGVDVRLYQVIYEVEKDVKDAMSGLLAPEKVEKIAGSAEVRKVFHINKVGSVAGCFVVSGTLHRGDRARIFRGADKIFDGKFASLKRLKDDVREVGNGFECGIALEGFDDIKEGDVIEAYTVEEVARRID